MKNRKIIALLLYALVLVTAFSLLMSAFNTKNDGLAYSEITQLLRNEQVKSFVVDGQTITLTLHEAYRGKTILSGKLSDPNGFRAEMQELLEEQTQSGVLTYYDFIPAKEQSPYSFVLPIILAGAVLLILWVILVGRANSSNPMSTFGLSLIHI